MMLQKMRNLSLICFLYSWMDMVDAWLSSSSFTPSPITKRHPKRCTQPYSLWMGLQVKIRIVGRKKSGVGDQWLEDAYSMYETRLKPSGLEVETVWHKNDEDLIRNVRTDQAKHHSVVLLDPKGKMCTSEEFCEQLYEWLDQGGSRLAFIIGGAEGLPKELRQSSMTKLSLSKLTFTHQFARTLLMEQIYKASEIRKGSGYHK